MDVQSRGGDRIRENMRKAQTPSPTSSQGSIGNTDSEPEAKPRPTKDELKEELRAFRNNAFKHPEGDGTTLESTMAQEYREQGVAESKKDDKKEKIVEQKNKELEQEFKSYETKTRTANLKSRVEDKLRILERTSQELTKEQQLEKKAQQKADEMFGK